MRIEARAINETEQAVPQRILSDGSTEADRLREQVPSLVVVGRCDCGCASVDFATPGVAADAVSQPLRLEGRVARPPGQPPIDIIAFVTDGQLSGLELVSYGAEPATGWPAIDDIEVTFVNR